ncbi:MAG: OmpH/Skp family outer membrane protein [Planctomycetota bacterium]|jgi:Skp family chaperone for outer membrane proteins
MKIKTVVLGCLMGVVVLFLAHEYSLAQPEADKPASKVGVVSVSRALRDCKATAKYRENTTAENSRMDAEEGKLAKEVQTLTGGVRALLPGSSDYMTQYKELLQKQAELKALQEFNNQQRGLRDRRWTEELYKKILRITEELAEKKRLELVLERSEPTFPILSPDQLVMTLSTHKVLYSGGCLDLTDEVIAELDKEE